MDSPRVTVRLVGVTEIEKFAATTNVTVVVCVSCPPVPLITSGYEPAGVDDPILTFKVVDPVPVMKFGVNVAMAPVGRPLTLKLTVLINPVPAVTVAVYDVALPGNTVRVVGVAVSVKSGTSTVRVTGALVRPPLSVTVNDATYDPGTEYVTLPGVATAADVGLPPGKLQA